MAGLIGVKLGMTRVFREDGTAVPVTAIRAGPCPVVQVKTAERDGYAAVQIGFDRRKPVRTTKAAAGHAAKAAVEGAPRVLREIRLASGAEGASSAEGAEGTEATAFEVGQSLTVELFKPGDRVKVTGRSKGRGFQGVVKRHGFRGGPGSHGQPSIRVPGSVGPGTDPSRTIKGRRMGGQMGDARCTVRNLEVVRVDPERNLLLVRGAVPGPRNGIVWIRKER
ncbi:MAG: 50S ribosomal protein L3 [Gemmatimonadota bacterium]